VKVISLDVLLNSELISREEADPLRVKFKGHPWFTAHEVFELDLPARNRVEALLRSEFLSERKLRDLACDYAQHTLSIFSDRVPHEQRLHRCLRIARLYAMGVAGIEKLQAAILESIPAVWQFEGTEFTSSFEAGLAVTFLDYKHTAEMVQLVARHTQRAAHLNKWERRKSWSMPMIAGELEATWQLKRIALRLA
jgi:hypothetical protein